MQVESSFTKYAGRVPPLDLSNVNSCRNENDLHLWNKTTPSGGNTLNGKKHPNYPSHHHHHHHHHQHQHHISRQEVQFGTDGLPIDPRDWSRADVWKWLINMAVSEGLEVTPELSQKFPMNGKALCLMSLDMYLSRVPVGGKMLYRDFRVRLARAMAVLS